MAEKKIGTSRDFIIHPGETIADVLEERDMTQAELALRAGVSEAYVSKVISGKKGISASFAMGLEYALGVPKSFWLNLQSGYEAELLETNSADTITEEERIARDDLKDVVKYLRKIGKMPEREKKDASILSLREALRVSNLANLKNLISDGAFRFSENGKGNPYVLGAWFQLCQLEDHHQTVSAKFDKKDVDTLAKQLKKIMCKKEADIQSELQDLLRAYGIDFSIVKHFRGAPVQGYISKKGDDVYQMVLTLRYSFADIFWFTLFHEIGHVVHGDLGKTIRYIDYVHESKEERAADCFASNMLLSPESYQTFIELADFSIVAIKEYAASQGVMPYIVIGRLQKEKYLSYSEYAEYKSRYKWAE